MKIKLLLVLLLLALFSSIAFAQDDGGKGLPGEDETPAPIDDEPEEVESDVDFPSDILSDASEEIEEGVLVLAESFDEDDAWEVGNYGELGSLSIEDGQYSTFTSFDDEDSDEPFNIIWGQNNTLHSDVVIQVTTEQISNEDNNGYGIMCRADPNNTADGYYLRISGDGYASISAYTDEGSEFLEVVAWTASDLINQGEDSNEIIAVCVGDYLALFVNGELAVEGYDDTFSEGVAGLSAAIYEIDEAEILFDDLFIWQIGGEASNEGEDENTESENENENASGDVEADVIEALEQGDEAVELGGLIFSDTFDEQGDWTEMDEDTTTIEVDDGIYFMEERSELLFQWGQNFGEDEHEDAVIQVDVTQVSEDEVNGFGAMCRLDPDGNGDGYMFFITGDGMYNIGYWEDDEYTTLIDFTESDTINTGQDTNTVTAVCVGEYLALYVNGELVAETEDDTFSSGVSGLALVSFSGEPVSVEYDNLFVWEAGN